jgi:murein DD-endopeptidase MepM/ murein hydrolase activator NlpD
MSVLAWPLQVNHIRRGSPNNAFGMVRNGGSRAHQGWDLYARPLTPCYAIADGKIFRTPSSPSYGKMVILEFEHRGTSLFAFYCHLSMQLVGPDQMVKRGDIVGLTGNTGNASGMRGDDQHLHFELRLAGDGHPEGLAGRVDPASVYGRAPIGWTFYETHSAKIVRGGEGGLRVPGVNVRTRIE